MSIFLISLIKSANNSFFLILFKVEEANSEFFFFISRFRFSSFKRNNSLHYPVKKVIKKINNHLIDKEDWLSFQLHFTNSHAQFFENLREKHPDLSPNEIKLSAYLKLNLSSKEIAALMNVANTSVEQSRYRLRKKFNLEKDVNLVKYIQKF